MKGQKRCSECIRRDRFCISTFFEILNNAHEKLQNQFQSVEKNLSRVLSRVNRLRKQIKLNSSHTTQKEQCVAIELNNDNDDSENENVDDFFSLFQIVNNFFNDF